MEPLGKQVFFLNCVGADHFFCRPEPAQINVAANIPAGLPDFSWCKIPKPEEMYQIIKYAQMSVNITNGHQIYQRIKSYHLATLHSWLI
jgi:hypothetical protein